MINNHNQIQMSEVEIKEALRSVLNINITMWTRTHDAILEEYKNVKKEIISGKIKDGNTIEEANEDFKSIYTFYSENFRDYGKVFNIAWAIKYVAEGKFSKNEIETIYRGKTKDLQETHSINIMENNHYIYMATVAIIWE